MSKPEQKINDRIRQAMNILPGVDAHRLELKTGEPGWPDWQYFMGGQRSGFIEAKWLYKPGDPFCDWRQEQRVWARRKLNMGFPVYIVVGDDMITDVYHAQLVLVGHEKPLFSNGKTIDVLKMARAMGVEL